jgi:hypothetical protein
MANDKNNTPKKATATAPAPVAPATPVADGAATPVEPKAPTAKQILVEMVQRFTKENTDTGAIVKLFGKELTDKVIAFGASVRTASVRGLSAEDRLTNVTALINAHWKAMPATQEGAIYEKWQDEGLALLNRQKRIKREIKEGGASRGQGGKANNEVKA